MSTFRLLGGAVATAIYSSIVDNQFAIQLPSKLRLEVIGTGFNSTNFNALLTAANVNTLAAYKKVPGITQKVIVASQWAVKLAYVEAFKVVYYTALGFALLAIISAALVANTDPAKKTLDTAVVLENEKVKLKGNEEQ